MAFKVFSPSRLVRRIGAPLSLSLFVTSMNGCDGISWKETEYADQVKAQGEIRVLTLRHPLVDDSARPGLTGSSQTRPSPARSNTTRTGQGFERELLRNFAETYGLKIRFIPKNDREALMAALQAGEGDVAAGRFWAQENRKLSFLQGPVFEESALSLFCRRKLKIQHISDLGERKVVLFKKDNLDSYDQRLRWMVPGIRLRLEESHRIKAVFRKLQAGGEDCVFAENIEGLMFLRLFPNAEKIEEPMTDRKGISWFIQNDRADLASLMHAWFQRASRNDEIMRIQDHHQAHLSELNRHDTRRFFQNLSSRFGPYRSYFIQAAKAQNLDWRLVASVAYQESHWNPHARSFTGVRGMMQLTNETAQAVGIQDRSDPEQSIWGGAFYLRFLLNRMPKELDPQERMALALAAYNSGLGHLRSAQALAAEQGLNPHSWRHLKRVYPQLEKAEIAARFPHGPARGRETVDYVERVRGFYRLWKISDR